MIRTDKYGNPYSYTQIDHDAGSTPLVCRRDRFGNYRIAFGSSMTLVLNDVYELNDIIEALQDLRTMESAA